MLYFVIIVFSLIVYQSHIRIVYGQSVCSRGQFLVSLSSSTCVSCPYGMTTASVGYNQRSDCMNNILHRYSFNEHPATSSTTYDSVGNKNATIVGLGLDIHIDSGLLHFKGDSIQNKPYLDFGYNIIESSISVSFEMWVTASTDNSGWNHLFSIGNDLNTNEHCMKVTQYYMNQAPPYNIWTVLEGNSPADTAGVVSSNSFTSLTNTYLVVVFDASTYPTTINYYVNGIKDGTTATTSNLLPINPGIII